MKTNANFQFIKKYKFILLIPILLCLMFLLISKKTYTHPIGGWTEIKKKLESEFKYNEDIKNAALQMGAAIQKSIDYPEKMLDANAQISSAMACIYAIFELQKKDIDYAIDVIHKARDIAVTSEPERIKRYIRFNSNLSGGVYSLITEDITKCGFKPKM